jgi:hypothetical protein
VDANLMLRLAAWALLIFGGYLVQQGKGYGHYIWPLGLLMHGIVVLHYYRNRDTYEKPDV